MDDTGLTQINPEPLTLEEMELQTSKSNGGPSKPFTPHLQFPVLRRIVGYLTSVQKYTGYLFTTFAGIHLTSVVIAPGFGLSMDSTQDLFEMARTIYLQVPGFETTFITGATIAHIMSGVGIRAIRYYMKYRKRIDMGIESRNSNHHIHGNSTRSMSTTTVTTESNRDDIGLGGLGSFFGLGYRKSWISRITPELTPLTFSGYLLIPVGLLHYAIFRWAPLQVDGDSSMLTIQYITQVLRTGNSKLWDLFHFGSLVGLVWLGLYHMISGLWKIRKRYSKRDKKLGYILVNGLTLLSVISLLKIRRLLVDTGFIGKLFAGYLRHIMPIAFK